MTVVVLIKYAATENPFGGFGLKVKKNNLQKQTGRLTLRINKFLIIN